MAWRIRMNKRELLYEQGTDEEIVILLDFDKLFDQMLLILKGELVVKNVAKELRNYLELSKKDFEKVYYGKFGQGLHECILRNWCEYVGTNLDKQLLLVILRLDIDEWETYFCNSMSLETLLTSMDNIRTTYEHLIKWDLHIKGLEDQVKCLEFYNNILKNEAL